MSYLGQWCGYKYSVTPRHMVTIKDFSHTGGQRKLLWDAQETLSIWLSCRLCRVPSQLLGNGSYMPALKITL